MISEIPVLRPWSIGAIYWAALGEPRGSKFEFFSNGFFVSEKVNKKRGKNDDMGVSGNRATPISHLKMIIFSRNTHG